MSSLLVQRAVSYGDLFKMIFGHGTDEDKGFNPPAFKRHDHHRNHALPCR